MLSRILVLPWIQQSNTWQTAEKSNVNGCETTQASWYDPATDSRWPGFLRQIGWLGEITIFSASRRCRQLPSAWNREAASCRTHTKCCKSNVKKLQFKKWFSIMHVYHESVCGLPKSSSHKPQRLKFPRQSPGSRALLLPAPRISGQTALPIRVPGQAKLYEKRWQNKFKNPKQKQLHRIKTAVIWLQIFGFNFWVQTAGTPALL